MSEPSSKVDANKLLDELLKATSSCYGCIGKTEEWSGVEVNEVKNELEKTSEKVDMNGSKTYVLEDQSEHEISNELVLKYIGSWIYDNLIDLDSRNGDKIDTGYPLKYFDKIVKYMANEYDIDELNGFEYEEFCRELMDVKIPLRMDIMNRLYTGKEYGDRWKNHFVVVNGHEYKLMMNYTKLGDLEYNSERDGYAIIINTFTPSANEILTDFENYLKAPSTYVKNDKLKIDDIIQLFSEIGIDISADLVKEYLLNYTNSFFCYGTKVLENSEYDDKLREWLGDDYKWKLLYRASEHGYTASSFHKCCDDKGPTLIVIKSITGNIFGGYTTESWSGKCIYYYIITSYH